MKEYNGSCHCGAIKFVFTGPEIDKGVRCNCSICIRKGAIMTAYTIAPEDMRIEDNNGVLATYQFASNVAQHHFCKKCGIYPFHTTMRKPGHYRANIGCIEGINTFTLSIEMINGASF